MTAVAFYRSERRAVDAVIAYIAHHETIPSLNIDEIVLATLGGQHEVDRSTAHGRG